MFFIISVFSANVFRWHFLQISYAYVKWFCNFYTNLYGRCRFLLSVKGKGRLG